MSRRQVRTNTELLSILQLADSFFPTGTYTMSNGLEALFKSKKIKAEELQELISTHLTRQLGPADCCALGVAYECAKKSDIMGVFQADSTLYSLKLVEEVRNAYTRSGFSLVRCIMTFSEDKALAEYNKAIIERKTNGMYPVALALACTALGIQKKECGTIFLYTFCVGMTGAALRLGILDHFSTQRILHNLRPLIINTVGEYINKPLGQIWQFAPALDVTQMEHERLDSKMFIT